MRRLIVILFLLTVGQSVLFGQFGKTKTDVDPGRLNGVWVHSEDSLAIVEIKNNVWTFIYVGDTTTVDDKYLISLKDTLFGSAKTKSKILVLDNPTSETELEYEILGLNDNILSLMYLPAGRLHLYNKKTPGR